MRIFNKIKPYLFFITTISSVILGALTGYYAQSKTLYLKPVADIFLNLLLTFLVPLVFFCISSAIARISTLGQTRKIITSMITTFIFTSLIAATFMLIVVILFPPAQNASFHLPSTTQIYGHLNIADQIVHTFSATSFAKLFSHENMLALMIFSILVGLSTSLIGEKGKPFANFLQSGADVFLQTVSLIMYLAPIGFFSYFATLVSQSGTKLFESYFQVTIIYYVAGAIYFFIAFTFYAYLAGKFQSIKKFWQFIFLPAITSLATCSSAASIPANLQAVKQMRISSEIGETVIPLGAILHKDGSVLGGVIKIAFLFGVFHMSFTGLPVLLTALLVSLLVGMVMGAIPSGGMLGELLILSVYGFPPQALMIVAAISILIDPLATMLNVTGDCVCSMMVARLVEGKLWINGTKEEAVPLISTVNI